MEEKANGWHEWGKHVLKELDRLNECYEGAIKTAQENKVEIAMLKVKSGAWGFLAGLLPAIGVLIYYIVKK